MGRRWGKTLMAGSVALACANAGAAVAWVVPTYKNARPVWRFAERTVATISKRLTINKTERTIEFPSGGYLGIYTSDNPVGILGEAFDLVILEEAARIAPDVWQETIMPTLADRDGRAMLISTPRGRNWFYNEFQRGLGDGKEQAAFTAPSSSNPIANIRKAYELAKTRVSSKTFRQEWDAEFVEDGGGVFPNISELSNLKEIAPIPKHSYLIGVDWARSNDASVFSVWDEQTKQETKVSHLADTDYSAQIARLKGLHLRYNGARVIAESNGLGDPLIRQAFDAGLPITPFYTSNLSKAQAVDNAVLLCEQKAIWFQDDPVGLGEMESFESSRTPTNLVKYAAPEGMHDDYVLARIIALSALNEGTAAGETVEAEVYAISSTEY